MDGAGARVAEGLAALLLFAWLKLVVGGDSLVGRDIRWLPYALATASLVWIVLTRALARRLKVDLVGPPPLSTGGPLPDS